MINTRGLVLAGALAMTAALPAAAAPVSVGSLAISVGGTMPDGASLPMISGLAELPLTGLPSRYRGAQGALPASVFSHWRRPVDTSAGQPVPVAGLGGALTIRPRYVHGDLRLQLSLKTRLMTRKPNGKGSAGSAPVTTRLTTDIDLGDGCSPASTYAGGFGTAAGLTLKAVFTGPDCPGTHQASSGKVTGGWAMRAGEKVRPMLQRWAHRAGWTLYWHADDSLAMPWSLQVAGSFAGPNGAVQQAIGAVDAQLREAGAAQVYADIDPVHKILFVIQANANHS